MLATDHPHNSPIPQIGQRYRVSDLLGRGGMGEVWQAEDRLTGKTVAIKRIRPVRMRIRTAATIETLRLTQEFRLLAGLHHPNIISVIDYGLDQQDWPFFVMHLIAGGTSITAAAATQEHSGRIRLLLQLFEGLAYLHRRGVLHRDLKPSNVLVLGDRLHIVDFGLSVPTSDAGQVESLAGTLHYLAPELIAGAIPSERSDLYAAGLLAYEVLTGRHAFRASTRNNLEQAIRYDEPDYSDPRLDGGLATMLRQLLAKNPHERPHDHAAIIALLAHLAGVKALPPTAATGGEGMSWSAPLVGRASELAVLTSELVAAGDGNGRARLITGMVGSGKTRLWEELRPVVLVHRGLVLEGRCPAEGGQPFAPWRQALRPLVLEAQLDARAAAVLKPVLPDIEQLIGRPVGVVPELDPGGTIGRLAAIISGLIRDLGRPVALVIEDLHWAGSESIELFAIIAIAAPDLPLLLLGTARSDEAPGLPQRTGVESITQLLPLDGQALEELASGTIGNAGRSRVLVDLLVRESEGNPFFAIEMLRTLIERAGGWDRVDSIPLPERLLVGGMRAVVERRLNRLDKALRPLADCAALAGRELDLELLRHLEPTADWPNFFVRVTEQGLVDKRGETWSFVHEQLRTALIEAIEPLRRRELHQRIATVLAQASGRARAAELTWHWRQAEHPAEECRWATVAAVEALDAGAYRNAQALFERVLDLEHKHPRIFPAHFDLLRLRYLAGDAAFRSGDLPKAFEHLGTVLKAAGTGVPTATWRRILFLSVEAVVQLAHRVPGGSLAWFLSPKRRKRTVLIARTWELLSRLYIYSGDGLAVLLCALRATNVSENSGQPLAYAHGILGCAAASGQQWRIAHGYFARTRNLAEIASDPVSGIDALVMEAASLLGAARFEPAIELLRDARRRADAIGYRLGQGQALAVEAVCSGYQGDSQRQLAVSREALSCIRHHSHGHQPGFRCGYAKALITLGRFAEARLTLDQARSLVVNDDRLALALIASTLSLIALREGNLELAIREDEALDLALVGVTAIPAPCAQLVEASAELVIARWHLALQHGDPVAGLAELTERRWQALRAWAKLYPIAGPCAWWCRGHQLFLLGRQEEAWTAWDQGRAEAVRLGMPLYEAQFSLTLSKHGPRTQQRNHRFRARALFLASQSMWHVRQLDEERFEDDSGIRYQAWLDEEGSNTRTAAYNVPNPNLKRDQR